MIDKWVAGSSGFGSNDSAHQRCGTIISWMQERKSNIFIVATANDVTALPPEFLRKGRWNEIFALDLPNEIERKEIFKIHLTKRNRGPLFESLNGKCVKATKDFTGSEIEAVIEDAMFNAFDEDREVNEADLIGAAEDTVCLAVTAREKIDALRTWASTRAKAATSKAEATTTPKRRVIG
jgi:SpoVK/Ycf46/Vps4 family AAA+-type ATPase